MQQQMHVTWPLPASELRPALELVGALARADIVALLLHDDAAGALLPVLIHGADQTRCEMIGAHRAGTDAFGIAIAEHRRVVIRDAWRPDQELGGLARTFGFRSIEIVPLVGLGGRPVGALALMYRHTNGGGNRSVKLVERLARLVVIAVQYARRCVEAEQARHAAELRGRARTQLFAKMSHELRTPLQSIAGYIDLLRLGAAEPLTDGQLRLLGRVYESEELLVRVIDDLITFSRLETGQMAYHLEVVSAAEAIRTAHTVAMPLATKRGAALELGECAGLFVKADPVKLNQILVNLTANAVKFTRAKGSIRLECCAEADGRTVRFDVRDDGPGIPRERLQQIFEPYVQLEAPAVDGLGGTGLGLAICREFATGMHGALSVASTLGVGSVFTLRLPRVSRATLSPAVAAGADGAGVGP